MILVPLSLLQDLKILLDSPSENNGRRTEILQQLTKIISLHVPEKNAFFIKPKTPAAIKLHNTLEERDHSVTAFLNYAHWIGSLKSVKRSGWLLEGIPSGESESVAEHSYRMAMLLLAIPERYMEGLSLPLEQLMKMCLIHDAGEAIVGDIPNTFNIPKEEKHVQEKEAIELLDAIISHGGHQSDFYKSWEKYEKRECNESRLVKDLDRVELLLQAYEYKITYPQLNCELFFKNTLPFIENPFLKKCAEQLDELRKKLS